MSKSKSGKSKTKRQLSKIELLGQRKVWFTKAVVLVLFCVLVGFLGGFRLFKSPPVEEGQQWALLVAGSFGYGHYRHSADICHAYQLLKTNGLKDTNIIVFMSNDSVENWNNPKRGMLFNNNKGIDYYPNVPHDYIGVNATVENFVGVFLGNQSLCEK